MGAGRFPGRGGKAESQAQQAPQGQPQAAQQQQAPQGQQGQQGQQEQQAAPLFQGQGVPGVQSGALLGMVPSACESLIDQLRTNPPHRQMQGAEPANAQCCDACCEALCASLETVRCCYECYRASME